jgi:hypothetical protein
MPDRVVGRAVSVDKSVTLVKAPYNTARLTQGDHTIVMPDVCYA